MIAIPYRESGLCIPDVLISDDPMGVIFLTYFGTFIFGETTVTIHPREEFL